MTKEEIKAHYTMADIAGMYGLYPNRSGFCRCPFHDGDRQASMKLYLKDFHCFGCGANGDIFTFVQMMDGLTFKEAYRQLGGTYAETKSGRYEARLKAYRAQKKRRTEASIQARIKARRQANNDDIMLYRLYLSVLEPMSELWCEVYNRLQYALYRHDILNDMR